MHPNLFTNRAVWGDVPLLSSYNVLRGDITADVAIVGAGITGLSTAYHLAKAGKNVVIMEQSQVGKGTTGSSTGNLYAPIDERLFSIGTKHNEETMSNVAQSRLAAIKFIEDRVQEFGLDCDFQRVPWHLFTTPATSSESSQVTKEKEAAARAGLIINESLQEGFPFSVDTFLTLDHQAQFNPLKYVQQFAAAIASDRCKIGRAS